MTYVLAPNQTVETFPYSISALRQDNPNTSFPKNPSNEFLASWNVFVVQDRSAPSFDPATQNCNQVNPTLDNGEWVKTWQVTSASSDEIAERLQSKSLDIREQRNQLLTNCDWTQLTDSQLNADTKTAWGTYRQQLRDITTQTEFPWNVQWPSAPS
jgi:hypothetical protein|tara:strand:+ start:1161 stop:1628 length:468 start_codon:yes stop_codon:yes gene_type:complete